MNPLQWLVHHYLSLWTAHCPPAAALRRPTPAAAAGGRRPASTETVQVLALLDSRTRTACITYQRVTGCAALWPADPTIPFGRAQAQGRAGEYACSVLTLIFRSADSGTCGFPCVNALPHILALHRGLHHVRPSILPPNACNRGGDSGGDGRFPGCPRSITSCCGGAFAIPVARAPDDARVSGGSDAETCSRM